jgi:hypothetical protein
MNSSQTQAGRENRRVLRILVLQLSRFEKNSISISQISALNQERFRGGVLT